MGVEGFSEVGGAIVEIIRMVTDTLPLSGMGVKNGAFG